MRHPAFAILMTGKGTTYSRTALSAHTDCGFSRWGPRIQLKVLMASVG